MNRTARTDAAGRFTITFPGGEGNYFVGFTALGFAPRRFEVKRTADQEILVADARLQRLVQMLDTMRAVASRTRVSRTDRGGRRGSRSSRAPSRTRTASSPGSWTRVFFADEAAAIAARYRPCGTCMREEYQAWMQRTSRPRK